MHYQLTVYLFLTCAFFGAVLCQFEDLKIERKVYKTRKDIDIFGYRGQLKKTDPSNSANLDLTGLEKLAIEAHKIMVIHARKTNKRGFPPVMMTAMRPGPPGTTIYFHSSLKGPGNDNSFLLNISPLETHPAVASLIDACMKAAGSRHANDANCGEAMALDYFAKEDKETAAATEINLSHVEGKLLVTVTMLKGVYTIISPCTSSKNIKDQTEKKPDSPRHFGCSLVAIKAGFQTCEIGWTNKAEIPTEKKVREMIQRTDVYEGTGTLRNSPPGSPKGQRRGLDNVVEKRARTPKKTVPKKTVPKKAVPKKTMPKKTPVNPVVPKKKPATSGKGPACPLKPVNFGGIGKRSSTTRPGKTTTPKRPTPKKKTAGARARRWIG